MKEHPRTPCGLVLLLCLIHWLLPSVGHSQSPDHGQASKPKRPDSSGLIRDWGDISNEEALDLPEKPEFLTSEPFDERMMELDEQRSIQQSFNLCSAS